MAFSHSPRKVVPLATGDEKPPTLKTKSGPTLTRRVFYCGVVVETPEHGRGLHPDVQDLVASLGDPLDLGRDANSLRSTNDDAQGDDGPYQVKRDITDETALADVLNEFVATERSYVKRLRTLKTDYADPLRMFSRSKNTAIIPAYQAKTLFGNIDNLLPVNEAFLEDLERMLLPAGPETVGGIGDVALKHFRDLKGFENYKQYYAQREEAQAIFEQEMRKAGGFSEFIDRIKYSSADTRNRVGLRELLMDPVQRIPRYTLLFRTMIKFMGPDESQRAKLIEADEIASKIALAETDDHTKRATIMYCLGATIEDFPPALISNSRKFIDCIDVEDVLSESYSTPGPSTSTTGIPPSNLHCSLVLFDDKLMIVKRPGNGDKGCRVLSGLADMDKLTKTGRTLSMKKSGMVCKGVVDITDVVVTDIGGPDMHLYLECPPSEQTERWAGRPFRSLSVVIPPSPINLDPGRTEIEKKRFLNNLWAAQARYRTRNGQSVVLCAEEREVENRGGKVTRATTFFNVYQRTAFLKEPKKTKIVLHIDETGTADPLPFGIRGPPLVVVRIHPMPGELSRYTVTSNDPGDEGEEDIVQTARVPGRIIQTIHQFGLFKFRTGNLSAPSTPTASVRSRAAIFGLDAISRNLFGALPGSNKSDIFGGSVNNHRRSKTAVSRSSVYTQSTSTGDGSLSRFSRSNSTATAATTMSLMDDDRSMNNTSVSSGSRNSKTRSRSLSKTKKLIKRGKSPGESGSERDSASPRRGSLSAPGSGRSRSPSVEREFSDYEEEYTVNEFMRAGHMDESERDLVARLELARRNSRNQNETVFPSMGMERPLEETIYEDEPPQPLRPASRASRMSRDLPDVPQDTQSQRSTTPQPRPTTPGDLSEPDSPARESRPISRHSDRRPIGPRCPSPLPPMTPNHAPTTLPSVPSSELDITLEQTLVNMSAQTPHRPERLVSPIPRSKRQPFEPTGNTDKTPRAFAFNHEEVSNPPGAAVEPLSIKKKSSVRENGSPTHGRKTYNNKTSALGKGGNLPTSPKRVSSVSKVSRIPLPTHSIIEARQAQETRLEKLGKLSEATKEDVESARRAIKRIKLDVEQLRTVAPPTPPPAHDIERSASPVKGFRPISRNSPPITKEAQARMDEMRQMITRRQGELPFRNRPISMVTETPRAGARTPESPSRLPTALKSIGDLATQADSDLEKVLNSQDVFQSEVKSLGKSLKEKSMELEKTRIELQSVHRQTEVVKELLSDCTAEKDILYEAFNEELDGMYNDANLPEEEAWVAMTSDLRETKKARAKLENENSNLKRRIAALEMQNEEWGALLRAHGLIP